ncbi:MAG: long-chain fatty acid transporter [Hydrogenophilales bacterium 28-61-23]|nr:MAG: long-chain fatty acid transporter [Hydrogenophilales bacterium 28-61-23]
MRKTQLLIALAAIGFASSATATNGYFAHGFGIKSKGMGGVGIAYSQDALAAATNPSGMVLVGSRVDFGAELFNPNREANVNGATTYKSGSDLFLVPEFGYNRMIKPNMSVGVSVYGNGGMNSHYNPITQFSNGPKTGVDLMQLFIAPTLAMKINENHAVGASLNLAYQRFKASGIGNFAGMSSSAANLSDNGHDDSTGLGVRIGWTGTLSPMVTMGATYQSKTMMSEFDKYRGLFAEQGDFDIPENYGLGIAVKATPKTTVALDVVRIKYGDVKSIANPISLLAAGTLGNDNGAGFGWKNQTVVKLGVSHQVSDKLTVRAGYNHGSAVIPTTEVAFNILAPATVKDHLTLGATWTLRNGAELSGYYMRAFSESITGATPQLGGGNSTIKMDQNALGIAYGWKM